MSGLDSLAESLQRVYSKIAEIEAVASQYPADRYVLANLAALKRDADALEKSWQAACLAAQIEICRYRLTPEIGSVFPIRSFSQSLLSFQELFSQIYDAAKGGTKVRARLSGEVAVETAFNFGFAYPGSLGVAMTVDSAAGLFTSKYDEAVDAFLSAMRLTDEGDVRGLAKSYGLAVVRRTYAWSKVNASAGYALDVNWTTSLGHAKGGHAGSDDFSRIVELITRISDIERRRLRVYGTLLGIDAKTRRFRFIDTQENVFTGGLADVFPADVQWAINTNYIADIESEATTRYAAEESTYTYRLRELGSPE